MLTWYLLKIKRSPFTDFNNNNIKRIWRSFSFAKGKGKQVMKSLSSSIHCLIFFCFCQRIRNSFKFVVLFFSWNLLIRVYLYFKIQIYCKDDFKILLFSLVSHLVFCLCTDKLFKIFIYERVTGKLTGII